MYRRLSNLREHGWQTTSEQPISHESRLRRLDNLRYINALCGEPTLNRKMI